jgi:hypothetical protein
MANPMISERRCAVSVKMAIEPESIPPAVYTAMKKKDTKVTKRSFLMAL